MSESLKPLDWYKSLADARGRRETGCFLVEGERAIRQIIAQRPEAVTEVLIVSGHTPSFGNYPVRELTEKQIRAVSTATTPQGVIAVVRLPEDSYTAALPPVPGTAVLLLEDIQDPGNAGTLIRTAAAFDFDGIILTGKGADPFSPKCVQSAAGTVLSLWLRRTDNYLDTVKELQSQGFAVAAADLAGQEDITVLQQEKLVLALGNEAGGLSPALRDLADYRFRLPVARDKAESLNVAVCGGICLYLSRQPRP